MFYNKIISHDEFLAYMFISLSETRSWEHANAMAQSNTTKPLLNLYVRVHS